MTTRITGKLNQPRKRPRQARSQALFDAVLEASARILETDGLSGLTTNAAADLSGISVGSLYQYFPNREAILAELTRRDRAELLSRVSSVLETEGNFETTLEALIEAGLDHQLGRAGVSRALDEAEPFLSLDAETDALATRIQTAVSDFLARNEIQAPQQTAADLHTISKALIDAEGRKTEVDRDALKARVMRAVMGYLRVT